MYRIIHVSDIHFWKYPANPFHLLNKRIVGVTALALGRASKFRLERVESLVQRVQDINPDHILITGDLTTTALDIEFRTARRELESWLQPGKVTIIPGNHDRYTGEAARHRRFEHYFGEFAPAHSFPWLRILDGETGILALDPTRPGFSAHGELPTPQFDRAKELLEDPPARLVIACHYPLEAPTLYKRELARKALRNATRVREWLSEVGQHLYCCGHVHAAWAYIPEDLPNQLCLNAGSPLFRDPKQRALPGFLEILLDDQDVIVRHHAWKHDAWVIDEVVNSRRFFRVGE